MTREGAAMDQDNPTVREETGYMNAQDMPRVRPQVDKKLITYTQGLMAGRTMTINAAVADDLVERGYAVAVDREVGEEG